MANASDRLPTTKLWDGSITDNKTTHVRQLTLEIFGSVKKVMRKQKFKCS